LDPGSQSAGPFPGRKLGDSLLCAARSAILAFRRKAQRPHVRQPFSKYLDDYVHAMATDRKAEPTIRARRFRAGEFLKWYGAQHRRFREIRPTDVDTYVNRASAPASNLMTRRNESGLLRAFFRHAERRGWCRGGIANGIHLPPLRRELSEPQSPAWKDVLRLLKATRGSEPTEVRARAVLLLFTMYALHSDEAVNLLVSDIDWAANQFVVRSGRPERLQQFAMSEDVAAAIRHYIEKVRPRCSCPNVFVTTAAPFRPVNSRTMSTIVSRRMLRLGIPSNQCGPQCLRHARAMVAPQRGLYRTKPSSL